MGSKIMQEIGFVTSGKCLESVTTTKKRLSKVDKLFRRFYFIWGDKFTRGIGSESMIEEAKKEWSHAISSLSDEQIENCVESCKIKSAWVPSIAEFMREKTHENKQQTNKIADLKIELESEKNFLNNGLKTFEKDFSDYFSIMKKATEDKIKKIEKELDELVKTSDLTKDSAPKISDNQKVITR